ncbi:hypothetical protein LPJ61_000966 [Coemansia biformis]|uniref:Uncharacterized protein n=1 Tax=Coemansia biformis TaxID=1286918 RepID=A0A9W8D0J6_9FUNG|nr:hypothetical protein LPJ61_000966 [Coemansia biformis]
MDARRSASILAPRTATSLPSSGLRMSPAPQPTGNGGGIADMKRAIQQRELERRTRVYWYRHDGAAPPRAPQVVDPSEYVLGLGPVNVDEMLVRNALFGPQPSVNAALAAANGRRMAVGAKSVQRPRMAAHEEHKPPADSQQPRDRSTIPLVVAAASAMVVGGGGMYFYLA